MWLSIPTETKRYVFITFSEGDVPRISLEEYPAVHMVEIPVVTEVKKQPGWEEHLARARAFRTRMKKRHGLMPDSVETLRQIREEHLNDIMGLR